MSEKLNHKHEQFEELPNKEFSDLEKLAEERLEKAAEKSTDKTGEIDKILKKIEREAVPKSELANKHAGEIDKNQTANYSHHQLASETFNQTLKRAQKKLPAPERAFSKVIHNSRIEAVSDVAGSTIARPSALLWGGLFSALASLGVLILCRYYGYEYNFTIGLMSFAGGYCLGLIVELVVRVIRNRH